jgi:hypothetical protein
MVVALPFHTPSLSLIVRHLKAFLHFPTPVPTVFRGAIANKKLSVDVFEFKRISLDEEDEQSYVSRKDISMYATN